MTRDDQARLPIATDRLVPELPEGAHYVPGWLTMAQQPWIVARATPTASPTTAPSDTSSPTVAPATTSSTARSATSSSASESSTATSTQELAATGADTTVPLILGGGLALAGCLLLVLARRRGGQGRHVG